MSSVGRVAALLFGLFVASSCSGGAHASTDSAAHLGYVSRLAPNGRLLLTPTLAGGAAGWCMTITNRRPNGRSATCSDPATSTGPVFAQACTASGAITTIYVLTRSEVAAVAVDGGNAIPTSRNATLPAWLRAAVIELRGPALPLRQRLAHLCPASTPLDANGKAIRQGGERGTPLSRELPSKIWEQPVYPPRSTCELAAHGLPAKIVASKGSVVARIRAVHGLIGQALLSCAETIYTYEEEHELPAAVLLDAAHPGWIPPPLPDMTPLSGYAGIFEAPGSAGENLVARRIPGAWLVVEEQDGVGIRAPIELLEHLRASVRLH